ncbi:cache domain-containing protein [Halopseudomonas sp.]|uniref:cache domain-containing protein n=1 Tax=Halopseudomonas sp. TaxID=2901191 RepID=UPI0030010A6A
MSEEMSDKPFLKEMPFVEACNETLMELGEWWRKVALIGKITSLDIAATILDDMDDARDGFQQLQSELIDNLVRENLRKLEQELGSRARFAIDILVRNLFERTADVGFLATDEDIRGFLRHPNASPEATDRIVQRLREYRLKYSVYDEILLLDPQGKVCAQLDQNNRVVRSSDPLIRETLDGGASYVETFRPTDLLPGRRAGLIYSAPVTDSGQPGAQVLGVLCLSFRFDDEMLGIFTNLARPGELVAILDSNDRVIASSNERCLPIGKSQPGSRHGQLSRIGSGKDVYLARSCQTRGYQGYMGLAWQGQVMAPLQSAFQAGDQAGETTLTGLHQDGEFISVALRNIRKHAARVTDDLSLIVLNGQIVAAKRDAQEFMPVLSEIRVIGNRTRKVFDNSISSLYATVLESLMSEVRFQAFLAVDIMDRNLYERANDVRWWALTSRFGEILAQPSRTEQQCQALTDILVYINSLYTVYTNLILFDTHRRILSVSNPGERHLVGTTLPTDCGCADALKVRDSQHYVVSPFRATPLYHDRPTYIYMTSVRSPQSGGVVGGIAIVFDSEPQFRAMLEDALPRDEDGNIFKGSFAIFTDRQGTVIGATEGQLCPGDVIEPIGDFFKLENGKRQSALITYGGLNYALGATASQGYREYKTSSDYQNDVLALVFVPV